VAKKLGASKENGVYDFKVVFFTFKGLPFSLLLF
jgi:hypothetical protein